ncbi:MAG: 4-oxalocrotonate tautomerase [Firmicutes bacterium]|nr:4-oxalocrotonate tautomerase [Bacillota bacterium]
MPTIKVEWVEGRTLEQKRKLAAAITASMAEIAQTKPERVKVEFTDIPKTNLAWGGTLRVDEEVK